MHYRAGKLLKIILLGVIVNIGATRTSAQSLPVSPPEELPVTLLPTYTLQIHENTQYACYTHSQQRDLFILEQYAGHWFLQWKTTRQLVTDLTTLAQNRAEQISHLEIVLEMQRSRILEIGTQLEKEIEAKNQYRIEAEDTDIWPLLLGGVIGIVGAGIAIGALLTGV